VAGRLRGAGPVESRVSSQLLTVPAAMDERWEADIDADLLENGLYAPVLVFVPPPDIGPPIRRRLGGEYQHPQLAEMAALDAFAEMSRR